MYRRFRLVEIILYISLLLFFGFILFARPPLPFLTLLLAPIALAALLYEFVGGTIVALAAMIAVALLLALDPDPARRASTLRDVWPILITYLAVGPFVGWLVSRERENERLLAAISEAGREIAASLDMDRTLQLVMSKAAETLPMDAGAFFVFDEPSQLYRVAVSHNLPEEHVEKMTFAFDEGVPGWVVRNQKPLIINDASADDRVHPYVIEAGVQSVLSIPMVTREKLVGVLNLFCNTGTNAFDDEALTLAQVYADQAAVFIENAGLVEELRLWAAELEVRVEQRTRELKKSQDRVLRAEKMAAVGRLAASVAHEVNNPLQAVALHLQLLAEEGLNAQAQDQIAIVQHELDRIAGIVHRLLDFQRPKGGQPSFQGVTTLVDDVLALAGKQLQQANVLVRREIEADLAPILGVGDQVKQVFLNLILNAIEAMPGGGELTIRGRQQAGQILITFADTGNGIEPEDMAQLFEPFFSTKHIGTGLGLAISQEIIARHGGELIADNRPGGGAEFMIVLPAEVNQETVYAS